MRIKLFFIVISLLILTFPVNAFADRGMVIPWDNVVLSEPGQKAFIAHNGREELLILSTDVKASESVPVLEFMPLPARPEVSLAKEDCFASLKKLVDGYNLRYPPVYRIMSPEAKDGGAAAPAPVELLFYRKLGVHQVIAVKINDLNGFASWVKDYLQKNKIPYRPLNQKEKEILADYFKRGFQYFVFDLIRAEKEIRTVPPLIYRFKCDYLYYPLKVTNLFGGVGKIELVCYADEVVLQKLTSYLDPAKGQDSPMVIPQIWPPPAWWQASTRARVNISEIKEISPDIPKMTGDGAYLQAFQYEGTLQFENDLWMKILPGEIRVFINNSLLTTKIPPKIIEDRCFVPAREAFTGLGATVNWDAIKREAIIQKDRLELRFPVEPMLFTGHDANGQKVSCSYHVAYFNGNMVILEKPPRLIEGRLLLPLRLVAESLGAKVEWNERERAVYIYYEEPTAEEREAVTSTLIKFFGCLQQGDFVQAASLFEPEPADVNWQMIKGLYPPEKDKEDILRYYCGDVNESYYGGSRYLCLLKPEVLCAGKVGDEQYRLSVQFRKEDGSVYIPAESNRTLVQHFNAQVD